MIRTAAIPHGSDADRDPRPGDARLIEGPLPSLATRAGAAGALAVAVARPEAPHRGAGVLSQIHELLVRPRANPEVRHEATHPKVRRERRRVPFPRAALRRHQQRRFYPSILGAPGHPRYQRQKLCGAMRAWHILRHGADGFSRACGDGDWFTSVCQEIIKSGKWTGIEIGFFTALGDFVASGTVRSVSAYFDAKPVGVAS